MIKHGFYTKTSLNSLGWFQDAAAGRQSREAARFGLELAQFSYDFKPEPWLDAGWTDVSIQVDSRLLHGVANREEERAWRQHFVNAFIPRLARGLTVYSNPITQLRGMFGAEEARETGKAVTMLLALPENKFVIAIGFMGTGRRSQDWAANMDMAHGEHLHAGFLSLARQFERNMKNIRFPTAAKALGLPELTLEDVLLSCREHDSPFRLVTAGHSQGAAVMQVWVYRRIKEGVNPNFVAGFGFASPMVACGLSREERQCPITHYLLSEDVFTRLGLYQHLGQCRLLRADESMRDVCYGSAQERPLFMKLLAMFNEVRDIGEALILSQAYLTALSESPIKDISIALSSFFDQRLAAVLPIAEERIRRVLHFFRRSFRHSYVEAVGCEPDEAQLEEARVKVRALLREFGAVPFTRMMLKTLHLTHSLAYSDPGKTDMAPYSYLVVRAFSELEEMSEPEDGAAVSPGKGS